MKTFVIRILITKFKNHLKSLIIRYISLSYRFGVRPLGIITLRFPGNSGYHFNELVADFPQEPLVKSPVKEIYQEFDSRLPLRPLEGMKILILLSSRANHKIHLKEMAHGIGKTLAYLGGDICFFLFGSDLESIQNAFTSRHYDVILLDSEMTSQELNFVKNAKNQFYAGFKSPRIIMSIYDLWRQDDFGVVDSMLETVDAFLHMDVNSVQNNYKESVDKFHLFPIARFWTDATSESNPDLQNHQVRSPTVFFSGSVRQVDRREILDLLIKELKFLRLSPCFRVSDPMIAGKILSKEDYFFHINTSEVILAPSQKSYNHFILTGRTVESLASENSGVLLQQEDRFCSTLGSLLRKDSEYLSFNSRETLREKLSFLDSHPHEARKIAKQGRDAIRKLFSDALLAKPFLM